LTRLQSLVAARGHEDENLDNVFFSLNKNQKMEKRDCGRKPQVRPRVRRSKRDRRAIEARSKADRSRSLEKHRRSNDRRVEAQIWPVLAGSGLRPFDRSITCVFPRFAFDRSSIAFDRPLPPQGRPVEAIEARSKRDRRLIEAEA